MRLVQSRYALKALTINKACYTLKPLAQWRAIWSRERGQNMPNETALAKIVDELGTLKAAIADLTEKEKELKTIIAASGYSNIDGELYTAAVSWSERVTLDSEKVRALLTPKQVSACSKTTEVLSVRVGARKRATGSK